MEYITIEQLKNITLSCQGLNCISRFGTGKEATYRALEQLGYVQIDTLAIIARAHHHTLWSRIPDYQHQYIHQLVEERRVFEYWFHAASYLPITDFRYALPQMINIKNNGSRYYKADPHIMHEVYHTIRLDGPKKARDFENNTKNSHHWWNHKPAKAALERLFMQGDLMIRSRDSMEKVYDLTERVLPESVNTTEPTPIELAQYLVETYLRAYGIVTIKQITHLRTGQILRKNVERVLQHMLEDKKIQEIRIQNMPVMYIATPSLEWAVGKSDSNLNILSPFDNSVIHRDRLQQLFSFDFRLECYTPQDKRQYGYFCLPILFGNTFVGRVDCKAHRKEKRFDIIHLHIENLNINPESWSTSFAQVIHQFSIFNDCQSITLNKVSPSKYAFLFARLFE